MGLLFSDIPPSQKKTTVIELDDGKIYRKTLYLMVKTMFSCRFSLKPIQWDRKILGALRFSVPGSQVRSALSRRRKLPEKPWRKPSPNQKCPGHGLGKFPWKNSHGPWQRQFFNGKQTEDHSSMLNYVKHLEIWKWCVYIYIIMGT